MLENVYSMWKWQNNLTRNKTWIIVSNLLSQVRPSVPAPETFDGKPQDLQNWLFGVEQYFAACRLTILVQIVSTAARSLCRFYMVML